MSRNGLLRAGLVLAMAGAAAIAGSSAVTASPQRTLSFNTMVGVPPALTGAQSQGVLRGISGGGLPWRIASGSGRLSADGHLQLEVNGLVLAAGANEGSNPISSFRGLVSCIASDGSVVNVSTAPFPATTGPAASGGGDAEIEADLALPNVCIAPIVFVTSPGGAWFATTGR